jgi:hypothetical protein
MSDKEEKGDVVLEEERLTGENILEFFFSKKYQIVLLMEEVREDITKATHAVERAQAIYDAALAEFNRLKSGHEAEYKILHPSCSPLDLHKYVMEKLELEYKALARKEESLILEKQSLARKEESLILEKQSLARKEDMKMRLLLEQQSKGNFMFSDDSSLHCTINLPP